MSNDLTLLVARILLVALFLTSGIPMLFAPSGFAGYMGAIGLPAPLLVTWVVIAVKILGSLSVLLGFKTRYGAYALAAFAIGSALLGHTNWADANEFNNFFKNFAIAGGFLALSVAGAGALSVDKR
ncbi:DoxX family protein [Mesorhizobium sp. CAU 1732]|uniref:DoxX family protein n=1 Tax=Mesorhizobium sp. CAU 1732 TaxID=3140358 RepID=UPI0032607EA5